MTSPVSLHMRECCSNLGRLLRKAVQTDALSNFGDPFDAGRGQVSGKCRDCDLCLPRMYSRLPKLMCAVRH
jgi:hypothetical protein